MLECPVCNEEFTKLKLLSCDHGFCPKCLDNIKQGSDVKCPMCRVDTTLPAFGVSALENQFAGKVICSHCNQAKDLPETIWCNVCDTVACKPCSEENHKDHDLTAKVVKGPAGYCHEQLKRYSALHVDLTEIQKKFVTEYLSRLEQRILTQLDVDLGVRLQKFAEQKQWLRATFSLQCSGKPIPGAAAATSTADSGGGKKPTKFIEMYQNVRSVHPLPAKYQEPLPKEGPVFSPPPIDEILAQFVHVDRFSAFSPNINLRAKLPTQSVVKYIGPGVISEPCDLCIIPEAKALLVSSTTDGVLKFDLTDMESVKYVGSLPPVGNQQIVSLSYEPLTKMVAASTLEDFVRWMVAIVDPATLKVEKVLECPTEPHVANSWYRWVSWLDPHHVLLSYGDEKISVVYICEIDSGNWKLLTSQAEATYRRAAVKIVDADFVISIPDMKNRKIKKIVMQRDTREITGISDLCYPELTVDLPVCLDVSETLLVIGFWKEGKIVAANFGTEDSQTVCKVGDRELISIRIWKDKVFALCKQREVVQVYSMKLA